jgi:tRNA pseudouridine55 synthase
MTPPTGILLVDKPVGPTSHDVVSRVRRALGMKRVGHAGTLDPFASGLLIILLGQATRLSEYLLGLDKVYEAKARLGIETTTHDPEGDVVTEVADLGEVTTERVEEALVTLGGEILQEPPVYSAKKVKGEAAHRRVRRGEEVELEKARVTVHEISLCRLDLPDLDFHVRCSAGTYIRALGRDLGRYLGVGAHLTELRRTAIGRFLVKDALSLEDLEQADEVARRLVPPAEALLHLPSIPVSAEEALKVKQGQFLPLDSSELPEGHAVRVLLNGELLAIGQREGDHLRPRKVLATG